MKILLLALACTTAFCGTAEAQQTYITDFAKTNDIFTNLNQQYPNTGPGIPGSGVGTPNQSTIFTPTATGVGNANNLNYANNGISYKLASNAAGKDFAEIGGGGLLNLPVGLAGTDHLYLLLGAYFGTSFNITLNGSGGATETFSNIFVPDFNGGTINSVMGDVADQTVFRVLDVGAGGSGNSADGSFNYYSLTQVGLTLDAAFAGQTLTNAVITSNGPETLVLGATATGSGIAAGVPEPAAWAMMVVGFGLVGGMMRARRRNDFSFA